MKKQCTKCKEEVEFTNFYKRTLSKDGLSPVCKDCAREYGKYRKIKTRYDLTKDEYLDMIKDGCEICKSFKSLVIDHNHDTGKTRGCLCSKCNTGMGLLNDSIETLQKTIKYLREKDE